MPRIDTESLRKRQIIEATRDVISEKGLDRTTMRDIGHRAGMSAAIVCYYFDDKKRLMKETLIDAAAAHRNTLEGIMASDLAPMAKLEAAVQDSLPVTGDQQREYRFWLDYWAEAARDPDLREFISESDARFRRFFTGLIEEGAAAGVFRSDLPAADLAADVTGIIIGLAVSHLLDPQLTPIDLIVSGVKRHLAPC